MPFGSLDLLIILPIFPSSVESLLFFGSIGRVLFEAPGGSEDKLLGSIGLIRSYNFVLKSFLFLIALLLDCGALLGPKMVPKSTNIKNTFSKVHFDFEWFSMRFL
jgi:hypothetical protein